MPIYRAQVVLPYKTNMPADVVTNTFHFFGPEPEGTSEMAALWTPRLAAFYTAVYQTAGIATYIADNSLLHVNWYDIDEPIPRVPVTVPLGAVIDNRDPSTLPSEVACVLSFQQQAPAGQIQARRRGRIYLGGLTQGWLQVGTQIGPPTFEGGIPVLVGNAANTNLKDTSTDQSFWGVWSPTNLAFHRVTDGWVDNTPDTQRRRGMVATSRHVWN